MSLFGYFFGSSSTTTTDDNEKKEDIEEGQWEFVAEITGKELEDEFVIVEANIFKEKLLSSSTTTQVNTNNEESVATVNPSSSTTNTNTNTNTNTFTIPNENVLVFETKFQEIITNAEEDKSWSDRQNQKFPPIHSIGLQIKGKWGDIVKDSSSINSSLGVLMKRKSFVSAIGSHIDTIKGVSVKTTNGSVLKGIYLGKQVIGGLGHTTIEKSGSTITTESGSTLQFSINSPQSFATTPGSYLLNVTPGSQSSQKSGNNLIFPKETHSTVVTAKGSSVQTKSGTTVFS